MALPSSVPSERTTSEGSSDSDPRPTMDSRHVDLTKGRTKMLAPSTPDIWSRGYHIHIPTNPEDTAHAPTTFGTTPPIFSSVTKGACPKTYQNKEELATSLLLFRSSGPQHGSNPRVPK